MERAENMGFVMLGERCFQNTELKGRESKEAEREGGRRGEEEEESGQRRESLQLNTCHLTYWYSLQFKHMLYIKTLC